MWRPLRQKGLQSPEEIGEDRSQPTGNASTDRKTHHRDTSQGILIHRRNLSIVWNQSHHIVANHQARKAQNSKPRPPGHHPQSRFTPTLQLTVMAVKVFLREKKISKGRKSLYLDFYPAVRHPQTGKESRREFLGMYIFEKPRSPVETQHNKDTRRIAENIRNLRYMEILNGTYGFQSEAKKKVSFSDFFENLVGQRYTSKGNYDNWLSTEGLFEKKKI